VRFQTAFRLKSLSPPKRVRVRSIFRATDLPSGHGFWTP
jgi:hypothetical protein